MKVSLCVYVDELDQLDQLDQLQPDVAFFSLATAKRGHTWVSPVPCTDPLVWVCDWVCGRPSIAALVAASPASSSGSFYHVDSNGWSSSGDSIGAGSGAGGRSAGGRG